MVFAKISILFLSMNLFAELNPLVTKQQIHRVRYISEDGKISYYQKRNGSLVFATNYAVKTILEGTLYTNHTVFASAAKRSIVIETNPNYLNSHIFLPHNNINLLPIGSLTPILLGKGTSPRLHLDDTWVSYFQPRDKIIKLKSTANREIDIAIAINKGNNPYFIPEVFMIDNNRLLYTDQNNKGEIAIFSFSLEQKKSSLVHKLQTPTKRISFCSLNNKLYIGTFGIYDASLGSEIIEFSLKNKLDYAKGNIVYESNLNDLGQLICFKKEKRIYFIKSFQAGPSVYQNNTDVVMLDPIKKTLKRVSEINSATQIIEMDNRILIPNKGKLLIVRGDPLKNDSLD